MSNDPTVDHTLNILDAKKLILEAVLREEISVIDIVDVAVAYSCTTMNIEDAKAMAELVERINVK